MTEPHPQRCETCTNERYYLISESQLKRVEDADKYTTKITGDLTDLVKYIHSRPYINKPKFNSTELLLLANDEWKRREERKHNHDPQAWQAGFINGFLTDWKWARDWINKIQREAALRQSGKRDGE